MKGKKYKIDKATGKLVECHPPNMIAHILPGPKPYDVEELHRYAKSGPVIGAILGIPLEPVSEEQQRINLSQVLDKADDYAERFDRRDTVRCQDFIQHLRETFLE